MKLFNALLGSALLAAIALPSAKANPLVLCDSQTWSESDLFGTGFSCQLGDKVFSEFEELNPGDLASATFEFEITPGNVFDFDIGWNPAVSFTGIEGVGYRMSVADPDFVFSGVALDTNGQTDPNNSKSFYGAEKLVFDYSDQTTPIVVLESFFGTRDPVGSGYETIPGGLTDIYVVDIFTAVEGATINNVSNQFIQRPADTVPGPLPLLGAFAAFGYSRKLRSRISAN